MLVTVLAQVNLDDGGVQWLRRSFQCPAQVAPHKFVELAGVTLKVQARECVDGPGTVRLLTEPLDGSRFVPCLTENMYECCTVPEGVT